MGFEFRLPDIGEGVVEGEIVKWLVQPGDEVEVDQPIVEVMTDKATVVIPSPRKGTVQQTLGKEGDLAAVGSVLVVLQVEGAESSSPSTISEAAPRKAPSPAPQAPVEKTLAAPATRRLARELGVAIETVAGTGPAGRVTAEDVRRAKESVSLPLTGSATSLAATARSPMPNDSDDDEIVPVRGVRGRIWDSMTRSAFTAPHFTFVEECDVTELLQYRARLNEHLGPDDPRLTFLPFIVKAVCVALQDFPGLNGQVDDAQRSFIRRAGRHIGVAVAADQGLTVPVVRHADRWSLLGLAREIRRLGEAVREGRVAATDLGGGTFTITSLGKDGGLLATPILNYPEVAILGVHRVQKRPMVQGDDDKVVVRSMMNLSLSCDHRLVDGHIAARFMYRLIELLSEPDRLVLEMG